MSRPSPTPVALSVVMPTLNQAAYIGQAVSSVLTQDVPGLELLVQDGGSNDGTQGTLAELAAQNRGRMRWVSEPDTGPADAVNKAVRMAAGPLIGWLNSDDLYTPGAAARAVAVLQAHPQWGMVYGEGEHVDLQGASLGRYPTRPPETPLAARRTDGHSPSCSTPWNWHERGAIAGTVLAAVPAVACGARSRSPRASRACVDRRCPRYVSGAQVQAGRHGNRAAHRGTIVPTPDERARTFWQGRFEVRRQAGGSAALVDWLRPGIVAVADDRSARPAGERSALDYFAKGFVPPALGLSGRDIGDPAAELAQGMFWQFPCRTEGSAWDRHAALSNAHFDGDAIHTYLGLPWATWIDLARKQQWSPAGRDAARRVVWKLGVEVSGLRHALAQLGASLRVHTVCQHIHWADQVDTWERLGITDLWLSHCPTSDAPHRNSPLRLHPWHLYAVNIEDPDRRAGLDAGKPVEHRTLLASFIGAHMAHYLTDARLRLSTLAREPGFVVRVNDEWHFEDIVYRRQIAGQTCAPAAADEAVETYNRVLCDSVFSLCPAGAGLNTLRLWESLASGAIPVLIGDWPRLPDEGAAAGVAWDRILVQIPVDRIAELPGMLRNIPVPERRLRQHLGMQAYACVRHMLCYGTSP